MDCDLWKGRTWVVWGEGTPQSGITLIGEAPGRFEDISGRPFVGRAGKLLDTLLGQAGLDRRDVYITNTVKCRPPENRDPLPRETEACSKWLSKELNTYYQRSGETEPADHRVILLLGRTAARLAFPGEKRLPAGVARSMELYGRQVLVIATFHPAAALRSTNGQMEQVIVRDLRRAKRYASWATTRDGQDSLSTSDSSTR